MDTITKYHTEVFRRFPLIQLFYLFIKLTLTYTDTELQLAVDKGTLALMASQQNLTASKLNQTYHWSQ